MSPYGAIRPEWVKLEELIIQLPAMKTMHHIFYDFYYF